MTGPNNIQWDRIHPKVTFEFSSLFDLTIFFMSLAVKNEQFFLITVQGFFSIVFALLICQFLMRTIFSTLPFHLLDSPPKMKLYYDIIIVVSCLHFFYALYITYEIIFQLNEDYLTSWW